MKLTKLYFVLFLLLPFVLLAQKKIEVGIDEKLGNTLPMDLTFQTSDGKTVSLKKL